MLTTSPTDASQRFATLIAETVANTPAVEEKLAEVHNTMARTTKLIQTHTFTIETLRSQLQTLRGVRAKVQEDSPFISIELDRLYLNIYFQVECVALWELHYLQSFSQDENPLTKLPSLETKVLSVMGSPKPITHPDLVTLTSDLLVRISLTMMQLQAKL